MKTRKGPEAILYLVILAFGFWFVSFYLNPYNFWLEMSSAVFILAGLSLFRWTDYEQLTDWSGRNVLLGVVSALGLYGIFWIGNFVVTRLIPFAEAEIAAVYSNSGSALMPVIGTLLVTVIGPGEEIFWRGTVQKSLEDKYGGLMGLIAGAVLYSLVHIWALNLTLLVAAFVCGIVWGWMYYEEGDLAPLIISHSLWSLLIFVIFPV
ncbi:MAG: type II CAAX endopeptidase family protein [Candidatus Bipolaricaulota bacterium]|nr:CPBP family intramembrane metalloprotease [Candidatus Bipolaricaulota bacterium]MBS3792392.1 CPBP family intramembrane metalloprotease [Candidatus Bipolaricaulota bacterium]